MKKKWGNIKKTVALGKLTKVGHWAKLINGSQFENKLHLENG